MRTSLLIYQSSSSPYLNLLSDDKYNYIVKPIYDYISSFSFETAKVKKDGNVLTSYDKNSISNEDIIFKSVINDKYIICQKINTSLSLLDSGEKLASVAQKLNFSNEYHYSKQFKSVTGMTPSDYRKNKIIP